MIRIANTKLYQKPVIDMKELQNELAFEALNPAIVMGINIIAWAKMIGITPAVLTFNGIY